MHSTLTNFRNNRAEILNSWLGRVFPEHTEQITRSDFGVVNKPLLYQVHQEFDEILRYMFSDDPELSARPVPVAKTLVKFKALNTKESSQVVNYPFHLKYTLVTYLNHESSSVAGTLLMIDQRIQYLLLAAFDFYTRTREDIYNIKLKELERGVFAGETAACPSGMMDTDLRHANAATATVSGDTF